jgi:hypothetical protein
LYYYGFWQTGQKWLVRFLFPVFLASPLPRSAEGSSLRPTNKALYAARRDKRATISSPAIARGTNVNCIFCCPWQERPYLFATALVVKAATRPIAIEITPINLINKGVQTMQMGSFPGMMRNPPTMIIQIHMMGMMYLDMSNLPFYVNRIDS